VLFNDRPFKDGEVPSNGEDLSGNDKMSKDSNDDNKGGSGGGGRDGRGNNGRKAEWEEDNSRRGNGENKFELDENDGAEGGGEGRRDDDEDSINADYPYSGFIDIEGHNRSAAIAGDQTSFYLQARDASGNNKLTNGDALGDLQSPEEQFTVDIVADHGSVFSKVTYLDSGKYPVDFSMLMAGCYQVHIKTGCMDIYCGLGEEEKCSPFNLSISPGAILASNCEAKSLNYPVDSLVEARADEIAKVHLQSKDAVGSNCIVGGDDVVAKF
jgi:hypothetical protein